MQYQAELQSNGACRTAAHLVGSFQNVQQRQVQLLGVAVGQGLLEQPGDSLIRGGAAVHVLQIQPRLPDVELFALLPAHIQQMSK